MSNTAQIDKAEYMAVHESILRSTVGIAANHNRNIGTGTLVSYKEDCFILTAAHVISGTDLNATRFLIPPSSPLKEHSMRKGIPKDFDLPFAGEFLQTSNRLLIDQGNDLVAIPLTSTALIPKYMRFFKVEDCLQVIEDGWSVLTLGFPVDNSAEFVPSWKAIGLTSEHGDYNSTLHCEAELPSSFNSANHFVLPYTRINDGIQPFGFSGAGAWCNAIGQSQVWAPEVVLAGVFVGWYRFPNLIKAVRTNCVKNLFTSS